MTNANLDLARSSSRLCYQLAKLLPNRFMEMPGEIAPKLVNGNQLHNIGQIAMRPPGRSQSAGKLHLDQPGQMQHRKPFDLNRDSGPIRLGENNFSAWAGPFAAEKELHRHSGCPAKFGCVRVPSVARSRKGFADSLLVGASHQQVEIDGVPPVSVQTHGYAANNRMRNVRRSESRMALGRGIPQRPVREHLKCGLSS